MRPYSIFYLFFLYLVSQAAVAADTWFQNGGVAIGGYDVVSYHLQKPTEGSAELSQEWNGVTWRFANETHQRLFNADPEKYAPRFGGYCAYAASKGALAPTDPDAWTIYHGRLYLNFSKTVRSKWLADIDGHIESADKNWPKLMSQE